MAGLPFRRAHHVTGEIVKRAEALGCSLADLPLAELQAVEPAITADVYEVLSPDRSVASRTSFGGTAPERVRAAIAAARQSLLKVTCDRGAFSKLCFLAIHGPQQDRPARVQRRRLDAAGVNRRRLRQKGAAGTTAWRAQRLSPALPA